jgi:hypothetical protein
MYTNQIELNLKNRVVKGNAEFRYLKYLKELNFLLKNDHYVSINQLAKKHKVARGLLSSMIELKIIKRLGARKFKWTGKRPTLEMANDILLNQRNKITNRNGQIKIDTPEPRKTRSVTPASYTETIETPIKVSTTKPKQKVTKISIFWGFLNFEIC